MEIYQQAVDTYRNCKSKREASRQLGLPEATFRDRLKKAVALGLVLHEDAAIDEAAQAGGLTSADNLSHFWKITKDENGNGVSLFLKNHGEERSIAEIVRESIEEAIGDAAPVFESRPPSSGLNLLVVDISDVHFLKLSALTETGYTYTREVARHRVIEGTRALLELARPMGIGRILFVLGNDILHVDGPRSTTTSGTYMDSDGTVFQGFKDAQIALTDAIALCAEVADVDLVHCMSNHDWVTGWTLSQTVAALLHNHPHVRSTLYNLSERHRKYYVCLRIAFRQTPRRWRRSRE